MLDVDEAVFFANKFGVAESQVRRDYIISHALGALATSVGDDVVFFGGTALTRTYLPDLRLSEDIDLIAKGDRSATAAAIQRAIVKNLRRTAVQRCSSSSQLRVLTPPAFAAAKLSAWNDRRAARDLYDMWAMATDGMIDADAVRLFSRHGPFASPDAVSFDYVPSEEQWASALAHQCRLKVGASEAAATVQNAWTAI